MCMNPEKLNNGMCVCVRQVKQLIQHLPCFSSRISEKRLHWGCSKSADQLSKNPVVRSKSYNIPLLLTPVAEYDPDASSIGSGGIRRHSACEIISCLEEQGLAYADLASGSELSGPSSNRLCVASQFKGMTHFCFLFFNKLRFHSVGYIEKIIMY